MRGFFRPVAPAPKLHSDLSGSIQTIDVRPQWTRPLVALLVLPHAWGLTFRLSRKEEASRATSLGIGLTRQEGARISTANSRGGALQMARMRGSPTWLLCASFVVVWLLLTPGIAARALRPDVEGKRLSEKDFKAADDAVPTSAKEDYARKYSEWDRFLGEEMTEEYGDTPAAANPSVPCC